MRSFRYVLADVFTDTPLAGNQLAVFTDARDLDELTMQALALELRLLGDRLRAAAARGRHTCASGSSRRGTSSRSPGHPCLGTAFVLGAPLQLGDDRARDGQRHRPGASSSATSRADRLRPDDAAGADRRAVRARGRAARGARRRARRSCRSRSTTTASGTRSSCCRRRSDVAALRPDIERARRSSISSARSLLAGSGTSWKTRMFSPLDGVGEDAGHRLGRRAARLPPRRGTASSRGARRSRSSRAPRSGGPRRSSRARPAPADTIESVEVGGAAVTVARGEFRVP